MPNSDNNGALAGVKILDLTSVFLGPYCTQLLGDMGADIIKIESPSGDTTRYLGPSRSEGMSGTFLNVNRNKRSCLLNLKAPGALKVLEKLLKSCDVLVHNMRPEAAKRLGITYTWAREINARIVYCAMFGFGEKGRYAGQPAFDDTIQAISGIAAYQGLISGTPGYCGTVVADKVTGIMGANAILAALYAREKNGEGQSIEVPMFETMVAFVLAEHMYGAAFDPPMTPPIYPRVISRNRKPYQTSDGYLSVVPYNDKQWQQFFKLVECEDLITDDRFHDMAARTLHIDELYEILAGVMANRTSSEWRVLLTENDIPNVPITEPHELFEDPHLKDVNFFRHEHHETEGDILMTAPPVLFSGTAADIHRMAPKLGQHTSEVLMEFGFTESEICALDDSGVTNFQKK